MAGDDPVQPAWRLTPAAQKLRSLSSQGALVPLTRVSSTIEDLTKNGQLLLTTAQTALQNAGAGLAADEWQLLKRAGEPRRAAPTMRRVASDTNFAQHVPGRLRLQRPPAAAPQQQPLTREQQQRQADAWDWLSALNSTLNQARAAQQSRFQLTRTGLEEQVGAWLGLFGGRVACSTATLLGTCRPGLLRVHQPRPRSSRCRPSSWCTAPPA